MKFSLILVAALMPLVAADKPARKTAPAQRAKASAKPVEIPAGAVETQPGVFRHTDADGKKWIYRKTPFGVARLEDKDSDKTAETAAAPWNGQASREIGQAKVKVKVTEDGDTIRFERPGPFGLYKWERKRAELTDTERRWLEESRNESREPAKQD